MGILRQLYAKRRKLGLLIRLPSSFGRFVFMSGARLWFANLSGANLSGANLSWADLRLADLSGAEMSNAIFKNTTMPDGTIRTDP